MNKVFFFFLQSVFLYQVTPYNSVLRKYEFFSEQYFNNLYVRRTAEYKKEDFRNKNHVC